MATEENEIDYSEIVERTRRAWGAIYATETKAYGIRINKYKGKQKLIYLPDMIEGEKTVTYAKFPPEIGIICNKRQFDRLPIETQISTAFAYLQKPEKFSGEFGKVPYNFIIHNKEVFLKAVIEKDRIDILKAYVTLMGRKIDLETMNQMFDMAESAFECRAYIMNLKSEKYTAEEIEQIETVQMEKEIGFREKTIADWKKLFVLAREGDGVCIKGYKGNEEAVVIPEKIGKYAVTAIGDQAFSPDQARIREVQKEIRTSMKEIQMPDTVMRLGEGVFSGCRNLEKVVLSHGISEIPERTFMDCVKLQSMELHAEIRKIGKFAFKQCSSLSEVIIPDSVIEFDAGEDNEAGTFEWCYGLKKVILPDTIENIPGSAFCMCTNLQEARLPLKLRKIGASAFYGCRKLQDVAVPLTVAEIDSSKGHMSFESCPALRLHVAAGSFAEQFARENKLAYVIDTEREEETVPS